MTPLNILLCMLQVYFLVLSATVERHYCFDAITAESTGIMIGETFDFCQKFNPYFLARPDWLVAATCVHCHVFWMLYSLILIVTIGDLWCSPLIRMSMFVMIGAKIYAILFYHYMEFTSDIPPPNPAAYFAAEGPYIVSIAIVLAKLVAAKPSASKTKKQ